MTKEDKINTDLDIISKIKELVGDEKKDAVMYVRADNEFEKVSINISGDPQLLSGGINQLMTTNIELRRFMFATLGSFLANNKEAKKEFDSGMALMGSVPGMN